MPDQPDEWWTITDTARYLGVTTSTVRSLMARLRMPEPERRYGKNLWRPETIKEWQANRPRKGQIQQ